MSKLTDQEWMDLFEEFWTIWRQPPKRKALNKTPARKKWQRIKNPSKELFDTIMAALAWFKMSDQWNKNDGQFIPMASTWIYQERWEAYEEREEITQETTNIELGHTPEATVPKTSGLTLREKYLQHRGIERSQT